MLTQPMPDSRSGRIFQISVSQGGVPKLARPHLEVSALGLVGDHQKNADIHGGPDRAVSVYSLERILALQDEGHPIYPGAAGENITLSGIDWELVIPGVRIRLGSEVMLEITRYTSPCETIADAFLNQRISRISQKLHPGWSRVYARVLQPGNIQTADTAHIE